MAFIYDRLKFSAEDVCQNLQVRLVSNDADGFSWCEISGLQDGSHRKFATRQTVRAPSTEELTEFGPIDQVHVWDVYDDPKTWEERRGLAIRAALAVFRYGVREGTKIRSLVQLGSRADLYGQPGRSDVRLRPRRRIETRVRPLAGSD